ncbi:MAG: Ig-like domain-containing protein [Proteobacteria bacterium]|jgi:hypothetical protein|nr:Ig-like domain-containing protein [Pseudomonadota bacterium]
MRTKWMLGVVFAIAAAAAIGCDEDGSSGPSDTEQEDLENPAVTMDNVLSYQGVSGTFGVEVTATDDVGIATVELLVDGEVAASSTADPFTVSWDTTALADGSILPISVRAVDTADKIAETEPVTVVVVNNGYVVEFTDEFGGTISIPADYDGTQEVDVKHHWNAPSAASRILGIVLFTIGDGQAEWGAGLDIGTGYCPDSGELLDSMVQILDGSPVVFDSQPEGGYPGDDQMMFFHIRPANPTDHLGDSMGYEIHAYAFD